jgi:hypothetical protein
MRREAHRLRRLAAALGALLLGACAAPGDGLDPPYLAFELQSAGIPAQCTAEDLAAAEEFAAVADAPGSAVAMVAGEPLCILDLTAAPPSAPRSVVRERSEETGVPTAGGISDPSRGAPPSWGTDSERLLKSGSGPQDPPPEYAPLTTAGGVVQDPTPQPAAPGGTGSTKLVSPSVAPAPSPTQPSDNN